MRLTSKSSNELFQPMSKRKTKKESRHPLIQQLLSPYGDQAQSFKAIKPFTILNGVLDHRPTPGPSRDAKQSPQGRMWTDIGRHTLQTSPTSWRPERQCLKSVGHAKHQSLSWTMILTGGLNMICPVYPPSQMIFFRQKTAKTRQTVHLRRFRVNP